MAEYIERDAALKAVEHNAMWGGSANAIADDIRDIPAADVVPVVHGRWKSGGSAFTLTCSRCGRPYRDAYNFNYCPNCGAKMDGDASGA